MAGRMKFRDAQSVKEFDIEVFKKGFGVESEIDGKEINEFYQFDQIAKITHYPQTGVEIISLNGDVRVFYNGNEGQSALLYGELNEKMINWMKSNLN
jgi:exoribonuclease R